MTRFQPRLAIPDEELTAIRARLTSMPAGVATVSMFVGSAVGVVALLSDQVLLDGVTTSILSTVVGGLFLYVLNGVAAVVIVHVVRVLRLVAVLHARATHIDLFHADPAHAFARVTAASGGWLIFMMSYSAATDPTTLENPVWISVGMATTLLGLIAFVVPLLGMRRRLRDRKLALLDASTTRIGRVAGVIDAAVDESRYADVTQLRTTLEALGLERERITRASTWPWEASTIRGFGTTLLLPIVVWLVTEVLGKTLGF